MGGKLTAKECCEEKIETKLKTLEEKRTDAMEVAEKKNQERKTKKIKEIKLSLSCYIKYKSIKLYTLYAQKVLVIQSYVIKTFLFHSMGLWSSGYDNSFTPS